MYEDDEDDDDYTGPEYQRTDDDVDDLGEESSWGDNSWTQEFGPGTTLG